MGTQDQVLAGPDDPEKNRSARPAIKASPTQNLLALVLLAGVVAALVVRLWVTAQLPLLSGPTHLAASANALYVNFDDSLYRVSTDRTRVTAVPLSALGIEGPLADIQVLRDGDLLVGDLERGVIRRCTRMTHACRNIAPAGADAIKRQFKFFAEEHRGELYIADTRRHRLLVQPLAGGELRELVGPEALRFPNALRVYERDTTVYVADTNHHRVVGFTIDGDEADPVLAARNELVRDGHTWPVSFARGPLGNWWVLSADGRLENADLIVYDGNGTPLRRIDLPDGADPVAVTRWAEELVISDRARFALYRVEPSTGEVSTFGSPSLERVFAQARERKLQYRTLSKGALAVLGILLVAAFMLGASVLRANQRRRRQVRSPTQPLATAMSRYHDVFWLPLEPAAMKLIKTLKRQLWLVGVGIAILTVTSVIALAMLGADKLELLRKCDPETLTLIGLLVGYLLVTLPVIVVLGFRALASRLGSDGKMLYFADHANRVVQVPPEEAVYTKRMIAFRSLAVPLKLGNGQALYTEADLETHIRPLLERGQRLGEINLMIYQVVHRHPPTIWVLVLMVAGIVLFIATDASKILF